MTPPSPQSTASEGEIVESDSEKATTSLHTVNGTNVNPPSRHRVSVSRSPSPVNSPKSYRSRTRSRSPYREPRGAKRPREDDHYNEQPREDNRRFKVRYESRYGDRPHDDRRRSNKQHDSGRSRGLDGRPSYGDRYGRTKENGHRTRSRSPPHVKSSRLDSGWKGSGRDARRNGRGRQDQGQRGYEKGHIRFSRDQSVSDRGQSPVAAASFKQNAETRHDQKRGTEQSESSNVRSTAKYVLRSPECDVVLMDGGHSSTLGGADPIANDETPLGKRPLDEASLIEERRKRREAIKARHRGQATPLLVQALAIDHEPAAVEHDRSPAPGHAAPEKLPKAKMSAPSTPKDTAGQDSPTALVVLDDKDLANSNPASNGEVHEDEPSAADYDPIMDMQEDRARQDTRQNDEVSAGAYDETATERQDVLLPESTAPDVPRAKQMDELDMFADEDDMFAEAPVAPKVQAEIAKAVPVLQSKAVDVSMLDDWDDHEGYYKVILGELLDNRYHVQSNLGRGMFSAVVRATDQKTGRLAAIKIIRNNESMKKAGLKEVEILQKLASADPEDKKHIIRLERTFEHKGHLCMVFENLSINLREVLKKFGRDVGINLRAVRAYAQQMFLGLSLLRKCNVLHADLKPDNVLVNESRNVLKVCDLGSASDASDNEITPYLVSRFYRAPEIILGMPYDFGIDVWSIGCTLFELYTGKILFTGRSNNQMLRAIMECRGKFSHKILRKAEFGRQHFDDLLNFRSVEKDKLTGKDVVRVVNFTKPTRDLRSRLVANAKGLDDGEIKELYSFIDLLDRCLNLNSEKRCSPAEALKHPFITKAKV
ncbi:MAG: hypothetical protein Q9194_002930 [Teloschistes cf. exilis]